MKKIKIGIAGYGNIGRGVELAIRQNPDMELTCVFTRRNPAELKILTENVPIYHLDDAARYKDKADVLILCSGSAKDLPEQAPVLAELFNTVDSFDTHAKIPDYFQTVDAAAKKGGNISIISVGWDPGMFSIIRLYGEALLPLGKTYTFWGKGVSQGHSEAVRRIDGVMDARQYSIPVEKSVEAIRRGETPDLTARQRIARECFVVAEENADRAAIEQAIKTMPDYFADYDTTVHFISEDELRRDHGGMPHGGFVIRSGKTGFPPPPAASPPSQRGTQYNSQIIEYSLKLDSNPEFTSSVLIAYARAAYRLSRAGISGAKTVFDIPPGLLSPKTAAELRKELL